MATDIAPTAHDIAKIVPNCPSCGSDRYYSVTENTKGGFRLKALRCDACQHDILAAFYNVSPTSREPKSSPMLFGLLAVMAVVELLFLIEILVLE